jgi:hypothetical protein
MQSHNLIRALLIATCIVIHPAHAVNQGEDMKQAMQTICLGRFLVDVPKEANYIGGMFHYGGSDFTISNTSPEQVHANFEARKHQLNAASSDDSVYKTLQISTKPITDVVVFRRKRFQVFGRTLGFNLEAYAWSAGKQYLLKSLASYDKLDLALQDLSEVVSSLKPRRPNEFPTEPGFCIDGAYLAGEPGQPHHEYANARFGLKGHPDVWIYMYTDMNGDKEHMDGGLLARVANSKALPADLLEVAKQLRSLRKGKHPVNEIDGEEILEALPTDHGGYSHQFNWEADGKPRSIKEPTIVVELETATADGGGLLSNSSLTDKQAIELFDAIVNSIRLRPTGPAKTSDASSPDAPASPHLPLGTRITSAANCPQSGMWECGPDAPGLTQKRRFIEAGQPMPYGYARTPKPGLPGLLGTKEDKPVEIVWTLAAYAQDMP